MDGMCYDKEGGLDEKVHVGGFLSSSSSVNRATCRREGKSQRGEEGGWAEEEKDAANAANAGNIAN